MKKILFCIVALAVLATMTGPALARLSAGETQNANDRMETGEEIFFHSALDREQYQLTKEQLEAPTDVLIEYILEYPYLVDLYTANTPDIDTYAILRSSFNGLEELESRKDAASALLKKYAEAAVPSAENTSIAAIYLYTLLSNPAYHSNLSEAEVAQFNQISNNCGFVDDSALS